MKLKFRSSLFVTLTLCLAITACKKDSTPTISTEELNQQIVVQASDASQGSLEMDAAMADAGILMDNDYQFSGNNLVLDYGPCDADVTASDYESDPRTITITFNGDSNCFSGQKSRTGKIIVTFPKGAEWADAGAIATVKYDNFRVVRTSDHKSVTINGTQTYTNVSGGRLYNVYDGDTSVRTIASDNMSVKFDSADVVSWHVARKYLTVNTDQEGIQTQITGTHTQDSKTGIAEWGTNRFGKTFTTSIEAPITISRHCNGRITSGTVTYTTQAYTASAVFGLNAEGQPTGCPESGGYYLKLQATTANNKTLVQILAY